MSLALRERARNQISRETMKIIVTVKQVPDTAEVRIDPKTNSLVREGVPSILNPEDRNAVETALALKEKYGGVVSALTMGPPQAEDVLEEVIAMGVDEGILLSDRAFAGSDTLITSFILSRAVMKIGKFDLIICGRQAIDGDTAQVGPQLAGFLDLPQVTYLEDISIDNESAIIKRGLEDCVEEVRVKLPALVTVLSDINQPRYPSLGNVVNACDGTLIKRWSEKDLKIPGSMLGLQASPTGVKKIFEPDRSASGEIIKGDEKQMAKTLIDKLKALQVA
jgi:electron transfer flavoprotein beta subunit